MGENEQGGMLRTVVVIGLIAIIAIVITVGVVGLKSNMLKNTDSAVGAVVTTKLPYEVKNPNISYEKYTPGTSSWGDHGFMVPAVGDIPTGNWRDVKMVASSEKKITVVFDINNEFKSDKYVGNDNDDVPKRSVDVYSAADGSLIKHMPDTGMIMSSSSVRFTMEANTKYIFRIKYFNNSDKTFIEMGQAVPGGDDGRFTHLNTSSTNGEAYKFNVESFEAATYEDKYNK